MEGALEITRLRVRSVRQVPERRKGKLGPGPGEQALSGQTHA